MESECAVFPFAQDSQSPPSPTQGTTDHYDEIHNFDLLCGVLLTDIKAPMSGELCTYPGSHKVLAQRFQKRWIDDIAKQGNSALPTGEETDELVRNWQENALASTSRALRSGRMESRSEE